MDEHQKIAAEIFRQHDLKFETAERAGGWTNAVWFNGDFVLRLSLSKGNDRIRREVELSKMLPKSVGYPKIIATGVAHGHEWSISERIQSKNLNDVWVDLSWSEKAKAVGQIFNIVQSIQSVNVEKIKHLSLQRAWYSPLNKSESLADCERYIAQGIFTESHGRTLYNTLEKFYLQLNQTTPVLNHGDITMDNLLWHEGNVVALIDFEHSSITAPQLDLHSLINLALVPDDKILSAEDGLETQQYIKNVIRLLMPMLTAEHHKDLLLGYAILFRQRFLEFWLNNPQGELTHVDAYQKLVSLGDGSGGYLFKLLGC